MKQLVCMRERAMVYRHPEMIEKPCAKCGEKVGIFPSGQRLLRETQLEIICDYCWDHPEEDERVELAPGAVEEAQELWRKKK